MTIDYFNQLYDDYCDSFLFQPITVTSVYILGEIISKMEIAQPLVRIFMHYDKIVPIIRALANVEISNVM